MSSAHPAARAALVDLVRDEGRRVLATLVRITGNWQLSEDAVQDAVLRALEVWPTTGVPDQPRAWITLTARNRAIDLLRREAARTGKEALAMASFGADFLDPHAMNDSSAEKSASSVDPSQVTRDDELRLIFTCCHPSLAVETQIALALRVLCGLSTAEVARALLVGEATMTKRLTRARQKIRDAAIPYRVPDDHELPDRLLAVASTVYLLFNEGYSATSGEDPLRPSLVDEAIRLARLLHELMPDEASAIGLLALVLLQDSRRTARQGSESWPILLAEQDRTLWRRDYITEGVALVGEGLRRRPAQDGQPAADPYVVQAAIAACHALASTWGETDWAAIRSWYDVLLTVHDTPVVRLNRAVAVAELQGPDDGLLELAAIEGLGGYPLWHAARAELLVRSGRSDQARTAFEAALALPQNEAQRAHLAHRLTEVTTSS